MTQVNDRTRSALVRWLLLACMAFGVVVMHHVMADHPSGVAKHAAPTAMVGSPMDQRPAPDPTPPHDVLHQCMAVVAHNGISLIVLLLLGGMFMVATPRQAAYHDRPASAPPRPPPGLAGRALLHSVCVARL